MCFASHLVVLGLCGSISSSQLLTAMVFTIFKDLCVASSTARKIARFCLACATYIYYELLMYILSYDATILSMIMSFNYDFMFCTKENILHNITHITD